MKPLPLIERALGNSSQTGDIVAKWDFVNAWPSKVSGPSIQSESSALGVEEMTLVHEGIVRSQ